MRAVDWTLGAWQRLARHIPLKPILFKEVGLSTATSTEGSEEFQREYYEGLLKTTDVQFSFFEGFDAIFKQGDVEKNWGIFRFDRTPKPAGLMLTIGQPCVSPLPRVWCEPTTRLASVRE